MMNINVECTQMWFMIVNMILKNSNSIKLNVDEILFKKIIAHKSDVSLANFAFRNISIENSS